MSLEIVEEPEPTTPPQQVYSANGKEMEWIRGVNLNGWLVLERYITPYLFAITTCDLKGDFCWYPDQIDAPSAGDETLHAGNLCDYQTCPPFQFERPQQNGSLVNVIDFPRNEYELMLAFDQAQSETAEANQQQNLKALDKLVPVEGEFNRNQAARLYIENHYDRFLTREDVTTMKEAGLTHVRVPIAHWTVGDITDAVLNTTTNDNTVMIGPWIPLIGWLYLNKLVDWCRAEGLEVWLEYARVPGWDRPGTSCATWTSDPTNVMMTLITIEWIIKGIERDGMTDVVTGLALLPRQHNPMEPCDTHLVQQYYEDAHRLIRQRLGPNFAVSIGPAGIDPTVWNEKKLWQNATYQNTYMESDYNQVFAPELRALRPRQHIAYACETALKDYAACCWDKGVDGTQQAQDSNFQNLPPPAPGVARLVGAWSAAYDTSVQARTYEMMSKIASTGVNPYADRTLSDEQRAFLGVYVRAQMVAYELAETGTSHGWFFSNLKTEGGAFAEWDFLRGYRNGWILSLPEKNVPSVVPYGTCKTLLFQAENTDDIVHPFPPTDDTSLLAVLPPEQQVVLDDDVVLTDGNVLRDEGTMEPQSPFAEPANDVIATPPPDMVETLMPTVLSITPAPVAATTTSGGGGDDMGWFYGLFAVVAVLFFIYAIKRVFFGGWGWPWWSRRSQYETLGVSGPNDSIGLTV